MSPPGPRFGFCHPGHHRPCNCEVIFEGKSKREKLKKKWKLLKSKSENPRKSGTLIKCDPRCNCEVVTSEVLTSSRQKIYARRIMIEMTFQATYKWNYSVGKWWQVKVHFSQMMWLKFNFRRLSSIANKEKKGIDLPQPTITRSKVPIHSEANCRSSNEGRSSERPRMEVAIYN